MGRIAMFFLFLFLLVQIFETHATTFTRHELLQNLTNVSTYDSNYPSGYDEDIVNEVKVQLDIFDMTSINDQDMEFSVMMLVRMQWQDDRLAFFRLANYSRLVLTGDTTNTVWTPDLYISNEKKTKSHSLVKHEELVYIDPDGVVSFSIRLSIKSFCDMNLKYYPFDEQVCDVTIQSYAFTMDKVMLIWSDNSVKVDDLNLPNFEVSVVSQTQGNMSNGNTSLTEGTFSCLNLSMNFKRKSSAYGSMYFAPYPIFFATALSSFGLGDEVGARITLCSAGMTTSVLQWITIYSRLPPVWYLTYLDGWILFHISIIGAILLYTTIFCKYRHQRKDKDKGKEMNGMEMSGMSSTQTSKSSPLVTERSPLMRKKSSSLMTKIFQNGCKGRMKACRCITIERFFFFFFAICYVLVCSVVLVIWSRETTYSWILYALAMVLFLGMNYGKFN